MERLKINYIKKQAHCIESILSLVIGLFYAAINKDIKSAVMSVFVPRVLHQPGTIIQRQGAKRIMKARY